MDERMLEPIFDLLEKTNTYKDYTKFSSILTIVIKHYEEAVRFDNVAKLLRRALNCIEYITWFCEHMKGFEELEKEIEELKLKAKQYLSGASYLLHENSLNEYYDNLIKQIFKDYSDSIKQLSYVH